MRRLTGLLSVLLVVFWAGNVYGELDLTSISKKLSPAVFKEISQIPEKPHYILGLEPKADEWESFQEYRKVFAIKDLVYSSEGDGLMDKSKGNYRPANTQLAQTLTVFGKTVHILYTHHHFTLNGDKMYYFWARTGERNLAIYSPLYRKYEVRWALGQVSDDQWQDIQRVLGWAQFEAVRLFTQKVVKWAVEKNIKDFTEMNLTEGVLKARSAILDDSAYKKHLDEKVPGTELTIRDLIVVPLTRPEDFLPDLIVIGPKGFYGGFANWKTPGTERIVFYDMLGLALWYVNGWQMPAHELVHTNPYLQGVPFSLYYEIEMWADLTTGLDSSMLEFLLHPYMAVVRDLAKTHFGYDHKEAVRKIFAGEFGARNINEKEFRAHARQVKVIRDELLRFVKDPKDGLMVRFYTDPYYWITVNTKFCDTAAAYRILFALRYEPAGLYDPRKKDKDGKPVSPAVQTKEWLMQENEAGKVKRLAEKAMEGTGKETEFAKKMNKLDANTMKCPVNSGFFLGSKTEQERFASIISSLVERTKLGDVEAKAVLMRIFTGAGMLPRVTPR